MNRVTRQNSGRRARPLNDMAAWTTVHSTIWTEFSRLARLSARIQGWVTLKDDTVTILPGRARARRYQAVSKPQTTSPRRHSGHIAALDGVRGLAIFLVLAYHVTLGMTGESLAAKLFAKAASAGWCGVDLFFVLSGFLITGILLDARESPRRFRNFYARRALRIFPLYYGTLLLTFGALPWITRWVGGFEGVEDAGVWLWLYGTNIFVGLRGSWFPLSHFWSLAVEEHFYLFWPAIVFWCDRRTVLRICGAMVVLALGARVWLVSHNAVLAAYCLTVCRMDALAIGSVLALAARSPRGLEALVPLAVRIFLLSAVGLLAVIGWRMGFAFHDAAVQTMGYLLLDVLFAALLVLVLTAPASGPLAVAMSFPPLRSLGRYSYGIYVYNSIFILIAEGLSLASRLNSWSGSVVLGRLLFVAISVATTLATAWVSWHVYEKQFLKWKRCFL
jgi:peptidoglycan/LPS O-acetylase OafA/YrhL